MVKSPPDVNRQVLVVLPRLARLGALLGVVVLSAAGGEEEVARHLGLFGRAPLLTLRVPLAAPSAPALLLRGRHRGRGRRRGDLARRRRGRRSVAQRGGRCVEGRRRY